MNTQEFNRVLITKFNDRASKYICDNEKGYKQYLKENPDMVENIGEYGQQIKPILDIDAYDAEPDIKEIIADIHKIFPNKLINYAKRDSRDYKGKMKYSYRFYVDGVRITSKNLKALLIKNEFDKNPIYDMSIYDKNKVLFLPLTTKKADSSKIPALIPHECDIFKCCASYIQDDFEDWDAKIPVVEAPKREIKVKKDDEDDVDDENPDKYNRLSTLIKRLKASRSKNFDTWFSFNCCLKTVGVREKISKRKIYDLIHQFSTLSPQYNECDVDMWLDKNYDNLKNDGYGWNYLLNTCIKEDDPEFYEKNMTPTYNKLKAKFEKTFFKCNKPIGYIELNNDINEFDDEILRVLTKKDLINLKENLYCSVCEEDKKGEKKWVKKPFVPLWMKDTAIRTYEKLLFTPQHLNEADSKKYYNLFNGFKAELLPVHKDYDSIQPILHHMKKVLCYDDEDHYKWLLQYYANILQNSTNKTDTIIVFKGTQGCGKSIFVDNYAKNIIGDEYSISTANPERHLLGTFNSCLINKVLGVCNEVGNDMRPLIDKLKDLATAPDMVIEKKGKEPIRNPNYININMTTNNNNPIDIQTDDRRICWLSCNPCYVGDVEYFTKLSDCFNDDKIMSSLYHYFKEEVKITITNFQTSRPITKEYEAIKRMNTPNYIKFLIDYTTDGDTEFKYRKYKGVSSAVVKKSELYSKYSNWCERTKFKPYNKSQFEERLCEAMTGIKECLYEGSKSFRFNQTEYTLWLSKFMKKDEDIEVVVEDEFVDE